MESAITARLEALADEPYRRFSAALVPTGRPLLGVRLPELRRLARGLARSDWRASLGELEARSDAGDVWAEELQLMGMLIGAARMDQTERFARTAGFVPRIDSWSVCDGFCASLQPAAADKPAWRAFGRPYLAQAGEFAVRFGVVLLLTHFKAPEDHAGVLADLAAVRHPGYYAKMAVAWAVSLRWPEAREAVLALLDSAALDDRTHRLALAKLRQSRRISAADKAALAGLARRDAV